MIDPGLLSQDSPQDGVLPPRSSQDGRSLELEAVLPNVSVTSTLAAQISPSIHSVPSLQFSSPASTTTMTSGDSPLRSASHPPVRSNSLAHREALESILARAREFQETVDAIRDSSLPNEPQPIPFHRPAPNRSELGVAGAHSPAPESDSPSPLQLEFNPRASRTNSRTISPTLSSPPAPSSPIINFSAYNEYILRGLDDGNVMEPETTRDSVNSLDIDPPYRYGESDVATRGTSPRSSQSSGPRPSSPIIPASSERPFGSLSSLYVRGPYPWRRTERLQSPTTPSISPEPLDRSRSDAFRSHAQSRLGPPPIPIISSARPPPLPNRGGMEARSDFLAYLESSGLIDPSTRDLHAHQSVRPSIPPLRTSQSAHAIRSTLALDVEIDRLHRLADLADQAPRLRYSSVSSAPFDPNTDGSASPRGRRGPFPQLETPRSLGPIRQHEAIHEALSHLDQALPLDTRTRRAPLPSDDDVLYAWEDGHTTSSRAHRSFRTSMDFGRSTYRRAEMPALSSRDFSGSPAAPRAPPGSNINPSRRPISLLRNGTTSTSTPAPPLVSHPSPPNPPRPGSPVPTGSPRFPPALGPFASRQSSANSAPRDETLPRTRNDTPSYTISLWAPANERNASEDSLDSLHFSPSEPVPPSFGTNGDPMLQRSSQIPDTLLPEAIPAGSNHLDRRPIVRFVNGDQDSGANDRPFWPSLSSSISSRAYHVTIALALAKRSFPLMVFCRYTIVWFSQEACLYVMPDLIAP
ncbi:hypothetical protein BS47DRAFT_1146671 [Hydnum rufescens UP504]|uniref:Uncharacterized protein n=1 Tax=Hydnum rufescens UP504 TaxID=1448309 RepID=A0A9P6ATK0_9AGAM|nr:hypothetical protein BS47DRAFT_1146671 [Hydnum rufescens UP504]